MIKLTTKELIEIFRQHELKVTPQRLAICEHILSRKDHPTVEQIYNALNKEYPTISLGTVYKTLHLLEDLGLVQELGFRKSSTRYDPDMELHINLVCSNCGVILDYKAENVKKLWTSVILDLEIKPLGQRLDIYYECENCSKML